MSASIRKFVVLWKHPLLPSEAWRPNRLRLTPGVTVIGRTMFASRITTSDDTFDWRSGDWDKLVHDHIGVPESIKNALCGYLDHFGPVFDCFDFAFEAVNDSGQTSEVWTFIECNVRHEALHYRFEVKDLHPRLFVERCAKCAEESGKRPRQSQDGPVPLATATGTTVSFPCCERNTTR